MEICLSVCPVSVTWYKLLTLRKMGGSADSNDFSPPAVHCSVVADDCRLCRPSGPRIFMILYLYVTCVLVCEFAVMLHLF